MSLTADSLCSQLVRSRLHSAEVAKQHFQRWQKESPGKASAKDFAVWLVAQRALTEYQAKLLLAGHPESLFLDHYKLVDRIGKGRMAGVYEAVHDSGQVVALKVLPASKAKDADTLARFHREAKLATKLNHPNTVRTYHHGEANGIHYLVMERIDGDTLEALLRERGKLPPREAVRIVFLAALGLQHVHELGLVHRDLKPGNLMLAPYPEKGENTLRSMVKLMDIGLGRALFESADEPKVELTAKGDLVGTPDYLAPEQARDARRADIRSDIYGLGCTLYHALTGTSPFPDGNPVRQVLRHATEEPRQLREFNPETPEGLQQIVTMMMAKDPSRRYQSPRQVADALKGFLAGEGEPSKPQPVGTEQRNYEAWLAREMPGQPAAAPAVPEPPAAARREAKPAAAAVIEEQPMEQPSRKRPRPAADGDKPGVMVARSALVEIDVEPVNIPDMRRAPLGLPLNRDVFMIAIGAVGVLFIVLVVWLLSLLFGTSGSLPVE